MPKTLRYTTFQPGELEEKLRQLYPEATPVSLPAPGSRSQGGGALWKTHSFPVPFPDGKEGTCRYERSGPRWHLFEYQYADGSPLPRQTTALRLPNDLGSIEAKGRELAQGCYQEAMYRERKEYFQRASLPSDGSRKPNPSLYQMKATKAKELAGKYALCRRLGCTLMAVSDLYDALEAVNAEWRKRGDRQLVVACCSRLDRRWQLPRFNPLYAEYDPREA